MNYEELGFKCGIEIHQRLNTHKLFCSCPSILRDDKPDFVIKRKLRAVAGESGEIDPAARFEMEKKLEFHYEGYNNTTCLVELDEEPIHEINQEALDIAFQVALLLNCKILDEIFVMRKTVIDGSNISGFQRTMLIARNGSIDTSKGKIRITSMCLEEEAAKNIHQKEDSRLWRLDRLGIPLIEIQTEPDIKDPDHARETAEKLGMILRSTNKVLRGIGSIRQDVNVSINHGARVEIKGFQDLRSMQKIIEQEVKRQYELIKSGKKVTSEVRKANEDFSTSFQRPMPGASRMYPETDHPIIKVDRLRISSIKMPELLTEKVLRYSKEHNISEDMAKILIEENQKLFEHLSSKFKKVPPIIIANTLVLTIKDLKTRLKLDTNKLSNNDFEEIFSYLEDSKIKKEAIPDILEAKIKGINIDLSKFKGVSDEELENSIKKIIASDKNAPINALMGQVMNIYRGKVSGQKVMELLKKHMK
jgi:Glu-tRNA(Gln) amidotransferase subunit E-like FAD-binding protein